MTTLTTLIKELRALDEKRTQGEWKTHGSIYIYSDDIMVADNNEDGFTLRARGVGGGMTVEQQEANIEFCAQSANALPKLLDCLEIALDGLNYIGNSAPGPEQLFELENKRAALKSLEKINQVLKGKDEKES